MLTGQPVFNLSEDEAKALAKAVAEVSKHYNVVVNPKTTALIQLVGTAGMIYFPRILHIRMERAMRKAKPVNPATPEDAATAEAMAGSRMDFSGDIPSTH